MPDHARQTDRRQQTNARSRDQWWLALAFKNDQMIELQANTDTLTDLMVMVTGCQTQQSGATGHAQGVEMVSSAKILGDNGSLVGAGVVVDDVIGPHQQIYLRAGFVVIG